MTLEILVVDEFDRGEFGFKLTKLIKILRFVLRSKEICIFY